MIGKIKSFFETRNGTITILLLIFISVMLFIGLVVNKDVYGPMHFYDEVEYWQISNDFHTGEFSIDNQYDYPPFYSIMLLPAFQLFSPLERYAAVKWLHAIYIASVIFPVYLLLRKFTSKGISLLGVIALVINPITLVIPRSVISENVFYPLLMWTVLLAFTNLTLEESKTRLVENLIFGILLALLMLTRYIALALVPGFLLIWWLKLFSGVKTPLMLSSRKLLHLGIVLLPFLIIMGLWMIYGVNEGLTIKEVLGFSIANDPNPAQLGKRQLVMWAIFYISYTLLIAAPYLGIIIPALFKFNLKKWQNDENRWWITLAIIVVCFLIPCIRHSWRVAYNYPDPVKLQGRYILYFGPLFLISSFAYIGKLKTKPGLAREILLFFLSIGLIVLAYMILFEGVFFLDGGQLGAAVNAPFGSMMRTMRLSYLVSAALITLIITLLTGKDAKVLSGFFTILLIGFYTYGALRVYERLLSSRQLLNAQIYHLVQYIDETAGEEWDRDPIILEVPSSSTARYARSWQQTLNFNGYLNNAVELNKDLGQISNLIFKANINGLQFHLLELTDESYLLSKNLKFAHTGKFYEYVAVPE